VSRSPSRGASAAERALLLVKTPLPRRTLSRQAARGDRITEGIATGEVITGASMSLDGYIADPSDNVGPLFDL
jgi:hypothetical protein